MINVELPTMSVNTGFGGQYFQLCAAVLNLLHFRPGVHSIVTCMLIRLVLMSERCPFISMCKDILQITSFMT